MRLSKAVWLEEVAIGASIEFVGSDIAGAMQHPYDIGAARKRFVEDDVVADREAANAGTKFRPLTASLRVVGKHLKGIADTLKQAIGRDHIVRCDE